MKPSYLDFDKKNYYWKPDINYRQQPELYRVGKGEQGVLICQPYKSEILPHWKFKDPAVAEKSSTSIYKLFLDYLEHEDFVGADLARKFLQMGFTRARRYANYKGGSKYDHSRNFQLKSKGTGEPGKAESAAIFYKKWQQAEANELYRQKKASWKKQFG